MTPAPEETVDVCVAGDGLIGLSIAYHLLRAGSRVAVVGGTGSGRASTAAAGMLTPACEFDPWMPTQFLDLLNAGKDYYPEFVAQWSSPDRVDYRESDFTLLDLHERLELLRDRMEWLPGLGFDVEWWEPGDINRIEPGVSPSAIRGAIRVCDQAVVNPIALWEALGDDVTVRGAVRVAGGVDGFDERDGRILVSTGDGRRVLAERVVIAAGSWSREVGRLAGIDIMVCPVKGQMVLLRGPAHATGSVIYMPSGGCGSLVERQPGRYVLGTSEEYLDPTVENTAGVVGTVLSRLCTAIPVAAEWTIEGMWAGFRPMTPDELPMIGTAPDPRFVIATGHHRNGVMLAPVTGRLVAEIVTGAGAAPMPFRPDRPQRPYSRFASKY